MHTQNYNTDQYLWNNLFAHEAAKPNGGPRLMLHDGMIGNGHEILARFPSDTHARRTLIIAGFAEIEPSVFHSRCGRIKGLSAKPV